MKVIDQTVQHFIDAAQQIQDFFEEDVFIGISDTETFLKYVPGKVLDIQAREGVPLEPDESMYECLKKQQRVVRFFPKDTYGVPFKSICTLIKNNEGSIVGCIGIGRSLQAQNRQMELSQNVAATLEEITASIDEISNGVDVISNSIINIQSHEQHTTQQVAETDKILKYIKNISDQTNMLGLNAAIEAARAGEHGRGFSVVAEEIRKLSVETKNSVGTINQVLQSIRDSVGKTTDLLQGTAEITKTQAESTQQIVGALEELSATSQLLADMAKDL